MLFRSPSRDVKAGEIISISLPPITRTLKVLVVSGNRVSAKLVPELTEDLTPETEYQKLKQNKESGFEFRPRGLGRPTKRERREIEFLKLYLEP